MMYGSEARASQESGPDVPSSADVKKQTAIFLSGLNLERFLLAGHYFLFGASLFFGGGPQLSVSCMYENTE